MDCLGTYPTHVQTCDVTRVQSATQWTASVHTGSLVVKFEACHTGFFESEEEKFKLQRVASTHSIAFILMDVAHPCVARKESSRDSTPLVELVLRLFQ